MDFYTFVKRIRERLARQHKATVQQSDLTFLSNAYLDGLNVPEGARALLVRRTLRASR